MKRLLGDVLDTSCGEQDGGRVWGGERLGRAAACSTRHQRMQGAARASAMRNPDASRLRRPQLDAVRQRSERRRDGPRTTRGRLALCAPAVGNVLASGR